jgi:hypothetical protein
MSQLGQIEKNSVRAYVFRFALNKRLMHRSDINSLFDHLAGAD